MNPPPSSTAEKKMTLHEPSSASSYRPSKQSKHTHHQGSRGKWNELVGGLTQPSCIRKNCKTYVRTAKENGMLTFNIIPMLETTVPFLETDVANINFKKQTFLLAKKTNGYIIGVYFFFFKLYVHKVLLYYKTR